MLPPIPHRQTNIKMSSRKPAIRSAFASKSSFSVLASPSDDEEEVEEVEEVEPEPEVETKPVVVDTYEISCSSHRFID